MIPLAGLTLPHFCVCTKPGPGFLTLYVVVIFELNEFFLHKQIRSDNPVKLRRMSMSVSCMEKELLLAIILLGGK